MPPPTQKQINFARSIANQRNVPLPAGVESDAAACSAYISEFKDSIPKKPPQPPSEAQENFAASIYEVFSDSISEQEFKHALTESGLCSAFIRRYKDAFDEVKAEQKAERQRKNCLTLLNKLDFIPKFLRDAFNSASTIEDKNALLSAHLEGSGGFSGLNPSHLNTVAEKLIGYWLEGMQSSAFEGMAKLDNILGPDVKAQFDLNGLLRALADFPTVGVQLAESQTPVRHIVLKLIKDGDTQQKQTTVVSVLPISPAQDENDPRGYRWVLAEERIPKFNRNLMGETTKLPGLGFDNVGAHDAWAMQQVEAESTGDDKPVTELPEAFEFWGEAVDILSTLGTADDGMGEGLAGWISRFMLSRRKQYQTKRLLPVFTVVDGSVASGTTRNVVNAFRQVLADPECLEGSSLALFRQIAGIEETSRVPYEPTDEATNIGHIARYAGHMDAFKNGARKAFPLDPAQRDALIALTTTAHGNVLAVNGPPGTGKTSLLRAVIASAWIEPLLSEQQWPESPLILACAATNQAVTNIISSFDETPGLPLFTEDGSLTDDVSVKEDSRWLPNLTSYGWYAAASPETDTKYRNYQLIGRKQPDLQWKFYGASSGLNELEPERAAALFEECATRYFDRSMSLTTALARLRELVKSDAKCLDATKRATDVWMQRLTEWCVLPAWTQTHQTRRETLRGELLALAGQSGRIVACQSQTDQWDKALTTLVSLQSYTGPIERQVDALLAEAKDNQQLEVQQYRLLKQLDNDLAAVAAEVETHRHATLMQRIKRTVANILTPEELQRTWSDLREAMRACGLTASGSGQPDFVLMAQTIAFRREKLKEELAAAAELVLRMRAQELVDLPADGTSYATQPRNDITRRIEHARGRLAGLANDMETLKERYHVVHDELRELDVAYGRYSTARTAVHAARDAVVAALCEGKSVLPDVHPILAALDSAIADRDTMAPSALTIHQRELVKLLQDWLDQHVRPRLFHFSARYWEGRFVQSRLETVKWLRVDTTYNLSSDAQLRELAMLAPVFVVTAYSAPKLMRRQLDDLEGNVPPYLFGEADLLIVDEAGQGTPEVGANAFLFAKRAIVVGDIEQLEPVWNLDAATDRLLAQRFGVSALQASDGDAYDALLPAGVLMARGSVMRIAQRATRRSVPDAAAAGLTLSNHYRCLTPIIEICNQMVYGDALKVATPTPEKLWRPEFERLGYLVVDSAADTKNPGGSRRNLDEAACIARWVKENESSLRHHFDPRGEKDLADIVAIVTPFKGQKEHLVNEMAKAYGAPRRASNDKTALYNRMVIDTVHSLQGAERPVVIFSMVESTQPSEKQFYDDGTNLINVAVSRAKDMFIVAMTQKAVEYARGLTEKKLRKPSDFLWRAVVQQGTRLNSRHVVVVESPNKRETIHEALGGSLEWEVIDTAGHFTQLADPSQWDIAKATEPVWTPVQSNGEKALSRLQQLWSGMATLYLATDPDPEGEAIAWHILRVLNERQTRGHLVAGTGGTPVVKRMRFHRLERDEIQRAQREASDGLDAGLVKSALARNFLDQVISTLYAKRLGMSDGTKYITGVGRVQLGILDLVNKADQRPAYKRIRVSIPVANGDKLTSWLANRGSQGAGSITERPLSEDMWPTLEKLERLLQHPQTTVSASWTGKLDQRPSYPAVNTARAMALAYRVLGLPPDETAQELQALYEGTAQPAMVRRVPMRSKVASARTQHEEVIDE
ncbi:AAA domain-containing protein [Burkholderia cepacia]|uniref:AAA domain-containing protein n=1 Tax=Burkholderia cepacia TaxID=292 RepID=UPI0026533F3F|nr:AAA domain-containing protein [Burkholderia cepacia]MDN7909661.1 AAA domain-containing protein [Burkholderia cepacia]